MSSDHSAHDSAHENAGHIIDEKSIHDKLLSLLSVLSLVGLLALGFYWQSLPLPAVQTEEESSKERGPFPEAGSSSYNHQLVNPASIDLRKDQH